jgi:hypothetical protein
MRITSRIKTTAHSEPAASIAGVLARGEGAGATWITTSAGRTMRPSSGLGLATGGGVFVPAGAGPAVGVEMDMAVSRIGVADLPTRMYIGEPAVLP